MDPTPLTQTRQFMVNQLPEYRPFALQNVVRAANFQGGAKGASQQRKSRFSKNMFGIPGWLDIFLYIVTTFVIVSAIGISLYGCLVRPYQRMRSNDIEPTLIQRQQLIVPNLDKRFMLPDANIDADDMSEYRVQNPDQFPPHPPPMLPLSTPSPSFAF